MISFAQVRQLAKKGNVIPLSMRLSSDLDTPVSAYMKLAAGRPFAFLLESIEGGEKLARYSFIGFDPYLLVSSSQGKVTVQSGKTKRHIDAPPAEFLAELFSVYQPVSTEDKLPRFSGGAVGYFGYDCIRWFERIPDTKPDMLNLPDMLLGLYRHIVVFDHLTQELILIANLMHEGKGQSLRSAYDSAVRSLDTMARKLRGPIKASAPTKVKSTPRLHELTSSAEYARMIARAKKYIHEGDIFQVVLSRRYDITSDRTPLEVYRKLRRTNPSPYMFLLNCGDHAVVGSSPEMLVRVEDGVIENRPIAGTRRRGKSDAEDAQLIEDLLKDHKELAEHTMLVDLGRNDLGRVSRTGSVQVRELMKVERYSHVMHLVSSVMGKLKKGLSPLDAHFACFPAGTVSGAPKIRAMEIIDELEPCRRGLYAGTIAYIDFWGNLDSCIAIRTAVRKRDHWYVQAGAGIVADSQPKREYEETAHKAQALIRAITED